jgi:hypothetical protein
VAQVGDEFIVRLWVEDPIAMLTKDIPIYPPRMAFPLVAFPLALRNKWQMPRCNSVFSGLRSRQPFDFPNNKLLTKGKKEKKKQKKEEGKIIRLFRISCVCIVHRRNSNWTTFLFVFLTYQANSGDVSRMGVLDLHLASSTRHHSLLNNERNGMIHPVQLESWTTV